MKLKNNFITLVIIILFFVPTSSFAKTQYDTFYYDYKIDNEISIPIKYEIKISKFKKPTKSQCSKVTVKATRLNLDELNINLNQEQKWRIRETLIITLISSDFYENKEDSLMRRTSFRIEFKNLSDKSSKITRCLTNKWDTSGMKSPMGMVIDGNYVTEFKVNFLKK